ncbi:hypothetical protein NLX83_32090 [Allokutzneria sp. A3M-2-11 16]|uniref:hypothetical protein n=1 Tax=Allokutzneria sp. A3M-2-11 16 TaxID=2962043 RepID=UPI0020B638D8|nr:hypothetical protein [Allokutzneria sp. A3M-2-11 16]MCP3803919.1 hypothetical protein [Allokutzneria sp. A3M-2-11 16]
MPKLLSRTRTRTDYLAFLLSREWPVLLSATGVVLGVVTLLPSALGLALSVIAVLLGTITLIRDVRLLNARWSAYDFSTIAAPFPATELQPPVSYPDAHYLHIPNRGTVMLSAEMDKALRTRRFTVEIDEEPYRLPARLRATAPHVLPLQARGRLLFNGTVLGMHGEPLPTAVREHTGRSRRSQHDRHDQRRVPAGHRAVGAQLRESPAARARGERHAGTA